MPNSTAFETAIPLNPAVSLYGEALACWDAGDATAAAERLDRALRLRPDFAEALSFGAFILDRNGKPETALRFYRRALELKPDMPVAWSNYGKLLMRSQRYEDALAAFDEGARLRPRDADLANCRAGALRELGRLAESETAARQALALAPDLAEAAVNLGNAMFKLGRAAEALEAYRRASAARRAYADALCGEGLSLRALGQLDEARERFARAEALGCREAVSARGCLDLMLGDFARGWEGYEARWIAGKSLSDALGVRFPLWRGPNDHARRVLVLNDHGLGDTIQFARYLPLMDEAGLDTTFICPPKLHRLIGPCSKARLLERAPGEEMFDAQIALSSLPRAFQTRVETVPSRFPYLAADPVLIRRWAAHIGDRGFRMGVVWQGNPNPSADMARSYPLDRLAPLAAISGVRLISLQKGFGEEQLANLLAPLALETLGPGFDAGPDAFADAAAAMMSLDLVVTCDTSIAHLAGALGRPVWIALKFDAEWRWMRGRDDSPWYPSARLFRQPAPGDWGAVFEAMAAALRQRLHPRTP